jgi:alkanesulfonate monooxygenase SsuD/methylene tetrahydromethanopterin reductase-like flavin-dependent oxidoreductase (luciferase family)
MSQDRANAFVGTGKKVAAQIDALANEYGIDEIAVVTWAYDEGVRRLSYQLLAEASDLQSAQH